MRLAINNVIKFKVKIIVHGHIFRHESNKREYV